MANQKISELTELAQGDVATGDEVAIVDTDAGSTKRFTWSSLRGAIATYLASLTQTLTNKTFGDDLNMGSNKITNVTDPTAAQDAATKNYVDAGARTKGATYLLALAQSTPDLTLQVLAGNGYAGADFVEYAGGNTGSFSVPVSNDRIDVLSIDNGGTLNITEGSEGASPTAPSVPQEEIPIAQIYMRPGATSVKDTDDSSNGYVQKDLRPFIKIEKLRTIVKTSNETVNNSATLQDDDELTFNVDANTNYHIEGFLHAYMDSASDMKIAFTVPSGASIAVTVMYDDAEGGDFGVGLATSSGGAISVVRATGEDDTIVHIKASVRVGGTAGSVTLQWAQNSAQSFNTIVNAGSALTIHEV